ncbi:MAG: hypothetical protein BGO00_10345, partial [Alphaproteobacteria bacterium 62-8]
MPAVKAQILENLQRQFARRRQDQGARLARLYGDFFGCQMLQQRQAEGGCLAGTGLGKAQHIAARQHQRNGTRLNGRGGLIALRAERTQDRLGKPEHFKTCIGHVESLLAPGRAQCAHGGFCRVPRTSGANGILIRLSRNRRLFSV